MDVSIIILNYHTRELTVACIDSLIKYTTDLTYEIILVENGSGEFSGIHSAWPDDIVRLVVSKENLGFAGGNNLGIRHASGKYILLLNSDTYLTSNAVLTTFDYMERHPRAGVVSARLMFPNGQHQSVAQRFPSVKYQLIELLRMQMLLPRRLAGPLLLGAFFDHKSNAKADWVWGAYFMFRSEVLDKMPSRKLDETFFMYYEDMQWCLDISRQGYEIHFCADVEVTHLMGGSSANKKALMKENEKKFMTKNYSPTYILVVRALQKLLAP